MKFNFFNKQRNNGTEELETVDGANKARTVAEEERDRIYAIIGNLTDGLLVFDARNRLSLINPRAEWLFDAKAEDVTGQPISELIKLPNLGLLMQLLAQNGRTVEKKELQLGDDLVLEVSTASITREGKETGMLVLLHDVTREKAIEKSKTEFVSLAAHQLRMPLSVIKWSLKMLINGDLGEISQPQKEAIEKTYESNETMIRLVNDLLNVTKIEEGRFILSPTPARLEDVIQSVINSLEGLVKSKKLQFKFETPERRYPTLNIDIEKIKIAVGNLIHNAIRYTAEGGAITVFLKSSDGKMEFSVKDTGVGIPKEQQGKVFSRFFRATNAVKTEAEGSGLGLYIARNIIEAHGGRVWFESSEGRGSTFYFTLPLRNR